MNIIIVEDEPHAARALQMALNEADPAITVIAVLGSVAAGVEWFRTQPMPDLAFMDIQLGDGLSFDIFERIQITCPVIFTTAYDEYALRAFKVNSIDYLLKPVDPGELKKSLKKYRELFNTPRIATTPVNIQSLLEALRRQHPTYKSRFLIPLREQFLSVPVEDIAWFVSENRNTFLITQDQRRFPVDTTLEKLENELDPRVFFRVNRQYIVAYKAIAATHAFFNGKLKIYLRGSEEEILISRDRAGAFKEWLDR